MPDPVELEVFKNLYHSIAEEMGAALRRTSFSPNIKERRDYSCAVFDSAGQVIAMGDHMPVHLGSMPMSVAAAVAQCELEAGDVVMLNDPFLGGTHLPDITLVMPVYVRKASRNGHKLVPRFAPGVWPLTWVRQTWPRRRKRPAPTHSPISTSPAALTTPTLAECSPDPWGPAAKFTRKACAFPPSKSCAVEESSQTY